MSGEIGEDSNDKPQNFMLFVAQVALGCRNFLQIFGDDYDTVDGTGVRNYIHVADLARSHISPEEYIGELKSFEAINIGTGSVLSVLQLVREFEQQSGKKIECQIAPRRPGDADEI